MMIDSTKDLHQMYEVMHSGAWLPVWEWRAESEAWPILFDWINENCLNVGGRLIVTPRLNNSLEGHAQLRHLANGAARQDGGGAGPGRNWAPGSGPIIVVWPQPKIVQRCVQLVAGLPNPSIILIEQQDASKDAPTFSGWAHTVGAFDASEGNTLVPDDVLISKLDFIMTEFENELAGPPKSTGRLYDALFDLKMNTQHVDNEYLVTAAIALGYTGDVERLAKHIDSAP